MLRIVCVAMLLSAMALVGCGQSNESSSTVSNVSALAAGGDQLAKPARLSAAEVKAPVNVWQRRLETGPNNTWENGIAYDPITQLLVFYGGHAWGYPQSNYTHLYDIRTNSWHDSNAPLRPQRRCLVMVDYIDSIGRAVCTQGGSAHGSMPMGEFGGDYKTIFRGDPRGPWLYDAARDTWEDCRTLPPIWKREAHAQTAYDASNDALVWIAGEKLGVFTPRTNRVEYRDLPAALHGRIAYAAAADPVRGKVVFFGGTGPQGWMWSKGSRDEAYKQYVHNDTWLYDVAADKWTQARPKTIPPRGMPLTDHRWIAAVYHNPSGTILIQQNPVDANEPNSAKWPATQLWSFDVGTGDWQLVPTANNPPMQGILAYAPDLDVLFLVGGGHDGQVKNSDGSVGYRASLSKQLWTIRVQVPGKRNTARPKIATSDLPWRPCGLVASVQSAKRVELSWQANSERDVVGYNVYRAVGPEINKGHGTKLNGSPIAARKFIDDQVDLSDGVVRIYYVTAVNKAGKESGASPLAYSFPDPLHSLTAKVSADGKTIRVSWTDPKVKLSGVNVYHVDNHVNTHGMPKPEVKAWYESWKAANDKPVEGNAFVFQIPAGSKARHHYFALRAVNVLGQEGFWTDIVSATDNRFHP